MIIDYDEIVIKELTDYLTFELGYKAASQGWFTPFKGDFYIGRNNLYVVATLGQKMSKDTDKIKDFIQNLENKYSNTKVFIKFAAGQEYIKPGCGSGC